MSRHHQRVVSPATVAGIVTLAAALLPIPLAADRSLDGPLTTLEGEARLRSLLSRHVVLVSAVPRPKELQDPAFIPENHGMAVMAVRDGRPQILTSLALVQDAQKLKLTLPDGTRPVPARVSSVLDALGLAVLVCTPGQTGPPCRIPGAPVAGNDATVEGARLYFVTPAGGGKMVVSSTLSAGWADPVMDNLIVAEGGFQMGMPLFDDEGRVAAVVVRPAFGDVHRSLASIPAPADAGPGGSESK